MFPWETHAVRFQFSLLLCLSLLGLCTSLFITLAISLSRSLSFSYAFCISSFILTLPNTSSFIFSRWLCSHIIWNSLPHLQTGVTVELLRSYHSCNGGLFLCTTNGGFIKKKFIQVCYKNTSFKLIYYSCTSPEIYLIYFSEVRILVIL